MDGKLLQFWEYVTRTADSGMISGFVVINSVASRAYRRTSGLFHTESCRNRSSRASLMPRARVRSSPETENEIASRNNET